MLSESYVFSTNDIYASMIVNVAEDDDFIVESFNTRNSIQMPANKIKKLFAAHGIAVETKSPIVTFYYSQDLDLDAIASMLKEHFLFYYPTMSVESIRVYPISFSDVSNLKIMQLDISKNAIRKSSGSFAVWFGTDSKVKRLFFGYEVSAYLRVLKASKPINNAALISDHNTVLERIVFQSLADKPIDEQALGRISAKGRIQAGDVIIESRVSQVPDVRKNSKIRVQTASGGVTVTFYATVQKNASIGETVDVKDDRGKLFNVLIISKDLATLE